jgi:hypothetical protein
MMFLPEQLFQKNGVLLPFGCGKVAGRLGEGWGKLILWINALQH